MKITVNKIEFVEALKNISSLVSTTMNPTLACVQIKTINNQIYLIATNGSSWYQQILSEGNIQKEGNILVNANLLYSITSKIYQNEITINQIDDGVLQIKTENYSCEINLTDNLSYPIKNFEYEGWKKITLTKDTLDNIKEKILPFVANISSNQYNITNGIFFNAIDEKNMEVVATDAFRIGYYKFDYSGDQISFVVGTELINNAVSILSSRKNKTVDLYFSNKNCLLKIDNTLMMFALYENAFPSVTKAILSPQQYHFSVKYEDLVNALNRGSVFVSKEKRPIVNFKIVDGKLTIKFISSEAGNSFEEVEITNSNVESYEVKFNQKLFSDLIRTIKSPTITFNFNQANAALVVTSENPYFINFILPIRSA